MATEAIFDGESIKLAGVYAKIKSGIKNPSAGYDYGKVMIIDTGSGAGFGFGAGISGTLKSGAEAIYSGIKDPDSMRALMKGGLWWKLSDILFRPNGMVAGASEVIFARAAATTPAEISVTLANATIKIKCKDEGVCANGEEDSDDKLTSGYAMVISAGDLDADKFVVRMYQGSYRGEDEFNDDIPYDDVLESDTVPLLVCKSPEVSGHAELKAWMTTNKLFNSLFLLDTYTITADTITAGDMTTYGGINIKATGGTETYSADDLAKVLDLIRHIGYSIILVDEYGSDASSTFNSKIFYHITKQARFEKIMIVGGGDDAESVDDSIDAAAFYDSESVVVVHGGIYEKSNKVPSGMKRYPSLFKAAYVAGRIAGLAPEIPLTFKGLGYSGEVHTLTEKEQLALLKAGVLYTIYDNDLERFTVAQGITSVQKNEFLINDDDATTHSLQIKRIKAALNKELAIEFKRQLVGVEGGVNIGSITDQSAKDWVKMFLTDKLVAEGRSNLLIAFKNITVSTEADVKRINYEFKPNSELTKFLITGFITE